MFSRGFAGNQPQIRVKKRKGLDNPRIKSFMSITFYDYDDCKIAQEN